MLQNTQAWISHQPQTQDWGIESRSLGMSYTGYFQASQAPYSFSTKLLSLYLHNFSWCLGSKPFGNAHPLLYPLGIYSFLDVLNKGFTFKPACSRAPARAFSRVDLPLEGGPKSRVRRPGCSTPLILFRITNFLLSGRRMYAFCRRYCTRTAAALHKWHLGSVATAKQSQWPTTRKRHRGDFALLSETFCMGREVQAWGK